MENEVLEKLTGTVEDVSFYNEDTGFCVAEINTGSEGVTVVGAVGQLAVGSQVECEGVWDFHASFGRQFKAETVRQTLPEDVSGILRYLSSGIIKGVRASTAEKIVQAFGADTFTVMEKEPERLAEIKGISRTRAREICQSFVQQFASREAMIALTGLGLTHRQALKLYQLFGANAMDAVTANPYSLIGNATGITFEKADEIVDNLSDKPPHSCRAQAGIVEILRHNLGNGHTCIPRDKILRPACNLLGCNEDYAEIAIDNDIEENTVVQRELDGREFLFLPDIFLAESRIAERIQIMLQFPPTKRRIFPSEIAAFEKGFGIEFDEKQKQAIEIAVNKGILILTGGPGTGKTTTVRGILALMKSRDMKVALTAPTGRAAQRMEELTGYEAKTIHRLLEVEYSEGEDAQEFVHNASNPLDFDAVIVDELSMVDVTLFAALLDALPLHCRLIMVGDKDQLPPVGAGNVLRDLIECGLLDVITLDKIFRQAMQSRIVTNAHRVVVGEMPAWDNSYDSDFFLLREEEPYRAAKKIVQLVAQRLTASYEFSPMQDIQVLCPGKMGEVGTQNLNKLLQHTLNPLAREKAELHHNGFTLRVGDKVMQNKNNYDIPWVRPGDSGSGVYNGDIGILTDISHADGTLTVNFDGKEAIYPKESVKELELAYAMTVHKSQGSEFNAVVMPVLRPPEKLAYRNLFYTALTRAKKLLVLVGSEVYVQKMVENDKKAKRFSALKYFIENNTDM